MAPETSGRSVRGGLSLYANLLDPSSRSDVKAGTISGAPVLYRQSGMGDDSKADSADKQQINAATLRFQPTKRPQLQAQKPRSKPSIQKGPQQSSPTNNPNTIPPEPSAPVVRPPPAKTTLADWTAGGEDNDVNGFYANEKRQRGGRKKKKKSNREQTIVIQNWDDIYDPSRPNNYEDYKDSDERVAEIRNWKDRLYAHRMARERSSESRRSSEEARKPQMSRQFAPPLGLNFAPPPTFNESPPPPPPPPPDDSTGEDAYARRTRLAQTNANNATTAQSSPPPPAPDSAFDFRTSAAAAPAPTIARAPVRYNLPPPPSELPSSEAELAVALENEEISENEARRGEQDADDMPRSIRPGQKGFAERLMSKYGWSKGSGLGASGSGIINPLRVQVEKQKKKSDSEGGGLVGPRTGTIVGGRKGASINKEEGKFGVMSEVVILKGMVDGMDLDAEMGDADGGLMQEIGEECGDKYGRVERVFIDRSHQIQVPVFVKFTSQLSALRAVNALEGRMFNGNAIVARFFDTEKFERGEYN